MSGKRTGDMIRVTWTHQTSITSMIASHPRLGKRPKWDVFDESKGTWEPKGEGAMLLWPGEGRVYRVRGVTELAGFRDIRRRALPPNARAAVDESSSDDEEGAALHDLSQRSSSPIAPPLSSSPALSSPMRRSNRSHPRASTPPLRLAAPSSWPSPRTPKRTSVEHGHLATPEDVIELTDSGDDDDGKLQHIFRTPRTPRARVPAISRVDGSQTVKRASTKGKGRAPDCPDFIEITDSESDDADSAWLLGSPTKRARHR